MPTLRLIKKSESSAPAGGESVSSPSATTSGPETVPIRFESLPTPLRAVVREQPDGALRIEAELPWLAVGTVVHGSPPGGVERTAEVSSFDLEVTSGGSARLVVLTAPSGTVRSPAPARSPAPKRRLLKVLLATLAIGAAAVAGYLVGQLSSPAMVLEAPWPAAAAARLPAPPAPPPPEAEQPAAPN
jgi:hypothetical protein